MQFCRQYKILKYTLAILIYPIMRHYEYKYGIHANANIHIGKGFEVVHGGNVFVNCSYVGDNVKIYPGVMLGEGKDGIPYVSDDVTIYTGAVVTGNIRLGKGCIIGANAFVSHDVEDGIFVAGVPAKQIVKS